MIQCQICISNHLLTINLYVLTVTTTNSSFNTTYILLLHPEDKIMLQTNVLLQIFSSQMISEKPCSERMKLRNGCFLVHH